MHRLEPVMEGRNFTAETVFDEDGGSVSRSDDQPSNYGAHSPVDFTMLVALAVFLPASIASFTSSLTRILF